MSNTGTLTDTEAPLIELCRCGYDTTSVPSIKGSHRYGLTVLGDLFSHTSRVVCPRCWWTALRRHQVPFRMRG